MYFNPVKGHYNRGVPEIVDFYVISVKWVLHILQYALSTSTRFCRNKKQDSRKTKLFWYLCFIGISDRIETTSEIVELNVEKFGLKGCQNATFSENYKKTIFVFGSKLLMIIQIQNG